MKKLDEMSKDEKSLLLYFEVRAVDHGGRCDGRQMNADDFKIAKKWNKEGFIKFGRIVTRDIVNNLTNWCTLSPDAFILAHQERIARAERMWLRKDWLRTDENIEVYGIAAVRLGLAGK